MSSSYLIDGIGDEVTVMLGIFLAVFVVIVSWMSTRVNDGDSRQFEFNDVNASEIIRTRSSQQRPQTEQRTDTQEAGTTDTNQAGAQEATENDAAGTSYSSDDSANVPNTSASESDTQASENVLRQRVTSQTDVPSTSAAEPSTSPSSNDENLITIRLKFMNDTIKTVQANPDETLDTFRRRNFPPETASRYRLIYGGQVLRDGTRTLRDLRIQPNSSGENAVIPVVHCFLSPASPEGPGSSATSAAQQAEMMAEELHIGSFFLPIIGVILIGLWYLCIFYTSLFSIQSLVSILGLTFLYIVLLVNQVL